MKKILSVLLSAILCLGFSGCMGKKPGDGKFDDNDKFYTIKMYMYVNTVTVPADINKVKNKLNEILREKINAQLDITVYVGGDYDGKMNTKIANYEEFDLVWTDFNSYYRYLDMEALYPLDYVLEKYGSDVKANFSDEMWQQVRHSDGKIYAAINNQILPRTWGIDMRDSNFYDEFLLSKSLTEESVAAQSLSENLDHLEDYMDWLRVNKPLNAEKPANRSGGGITHGFELPYLLECLGFDALGMGMTVPGVVRADKSGKPVVVNQFEQPEFIEVIERIKEWYGNYIPTDINEGGYDTSLDVIPARTWKPGTTVQRTIGGVVRNRHTYRFGDPYYLQTYIMGTMWGIGSISKNPARTMKFINLMHTDAEVHNLLKIGIEGDHYNVVDGQAVQTTNSAKYNLDTVRWTFGNELIGLPLSTQPKDIFEQTAKINEDTPLTDIIGFRFDRKPVTTEIQLCTTIAADALNAFGNGKIYNAQPNTYTKFLTDLNNAGAQKIIAEKQRQLDEWLEANEYNY